MELLLLSTLQFSFSEPSFSYLTHGVLMGLNLNYQLRGKSHDPGMGNQHIPLFWFKVVLVTQYKTIRLNSATFVGIS